MKIIIQSWIQLFSCFIILFLFLGETLFWLLETCRKNQQCTATITKLLPHTYFNIFMLPYLFFLSTSIYHSLDSLQIKNQNQWHCDAIYVSSPKIGSNQIPLFHLDCQIDSLICLGTSFPFFACFLPFCIRIISLLPFLSLLWSIIRPFIINCK